MIDITSILYNTIKVSSIVFISSAFLVGINALLGLLGAWVSTTFIGEFFSLVSMYLPFNSATVFASVVVSLIGIFTFLVAKKIFDLASWSVNSA